MAGFFVFVDDGHYYDLYNRLQADLTGLAVVGCVEGNKNCF